MLFTLRGKRGSDAAPVALDAFLSTRPDGLAGRMIGDAMLGELVREANRIDPVSRLDQDRLRRLIEAGRSLVSEHELEQVLDRLLAVARELTGARFAAIGGVDDRPEPLALADGGAHLRSHESPPGRPALRRVLRVPIVIGEEAWGNLYLSDKHDGRELDGADEGSAVVLTDWAAVAVENARRHRKADELRTKLEATVRALALTAAQLEADLKSSTADLAASRTRLVETADAERQRIERDLHDGVQQDLVGLRIKLDAVAEAIKGEPERSEQMIASLGRQMDDVLEELRSLARGIYPSILNQRGVGEALKSAARRSPLPVSVDARGVCRYREDVEVAVYFCCLEALQNFVKHAGLDAHAAIRVREQARRLRFEVRDSGAGFDSDEIHDRHGLLNMRDRIEAVGGTLTVSSRTGQGTVVRGSVPIA